MDGQDDIVELGHAPVRWRRPPPIAIVLAAAGLLAGLIAGLVAGYTAGLRQAGPSAAPPSRPRASATSAPADDAFPLSQTGRQCSAQIGPGLQLGVQVANSSLAAVTLQQVTVILPLGGLQRISQAWGPCGELPTGSGIADNIVPPGGSAWFTVTFKVLVKCPGPLPVQFILSYHQPDRGDTSYLPGFDDLGDVPHANCPVS